MQVYNSALHSLFKKFLKICRAENNIQIVIDIINLEIFYSPSETFKNDATKESGRLRVTETSTVKELTNEYRYLCILFQPMQALF